MTLSLPLLDDKVTNSLADVRSKLAVRAVLAEQLSNLDGKVVALTQNIANMEEAALVVGAVEKAQQEQLKVKLEKLISYALTVIFERTYQFVVQFESRGAQSEARFMVVDEQGSMQSIKDAHGGGLLVVVAYLLRAIVMMSAQPRLVPLMIDDEPFAQVSADFRPRLVEFLQKFAESSGVQLIIVTHMQDLADIGDKKYRFKLVNGKTVVEEI